MADAHCSADPLSQLGCCQVPTELASCPRPVRHRLSIATQPCAATAPLLHCTIHVLCFWHTFFQLHAGLSASSTAVPVTLGHEECAKLYSSSLPSGCVHPLFNSWPVCPYCAHRHVHRSQPPSHALPCTVGLVAQMQCGRGEETLSRRGVADSGAEKKLNHADGKSCGRRRAAGTLYKQPTAFGNTGHHMKCTKVVICGRTSGWLCFWASAPRLEAL